MYNLYPMECRSACLIKKNVRPFQGIYPGCSIGCSRYVGTGKSDGANKVFNLTLALCAIFSVILVGAYILFPEQILTLCGVDLNKYPELQPHIFGYLNGYLPAIPSILFITVMGPIVVMDNDSRLFTISSVVALVAKGIQNDM